MTYWTPFGIKIFLQLRHGTILPWYLTEWKETFPISICFFFFLFFSFFFLTIAVYEIILLCREQRNVSEGLLLLFILENVRFLSGKMRYQQILFNLNFWCTKQSLMNHVMHSRDQLVQILSNCIRRACLIICLEPFSLEQICKQTLSV